MRPTAWQVFYNPAVFVEALTQAGVKDAQAKVSGIVRHMAQAYMFKRQIDQLTENRQEILTRDVTPNKRLNPKRHRHLVLQNYKRQRSIKRIIEAFEPYLASITSKVETKISKWPDLTIGQVKLKKRISKFDYNALVKKRIRRRNSA